MALNETLETLFAKTTDAALAMGHGAKTLVLISRKRAQIVKEQEKIRRCYARLGKVYYKDYITDEEPDEAEYVPVCDEISESFRLINQLKAEIEEAKASVNETDPAPVVNAEPLDEDIPADVDVEPVEVEPVEVAPVEAPAAAPAEEPAAAPVEARVHIVPVDDISEDDLFEPMIGIIHNTPEAPVE